ncbi:hypothetical protein C8J56DRAFT_891756 [Mycena floridula]|nr:hypothetical protein C8J56DRAFT_891756 [Mycena floridula]
MNGANQQFPGQLQTRRPTIQEQALADLQQVVERYKRNEFSRRDADTRLTDALRRGSADLNIPYNARNLNAYIQQLDAHDQNVGQAQARGEQRTSGASGGFFPGLGRGRSPERIGDTPVLEEGSVVHHQFSKEIGEANRGINEAKTEPIQLIIIIL